MCERCDRLSFEARNLTERRRFGDWLETTADLQQAFGVNWKKLRANPVDLADYITWNLTAVMEELGELSHGLHWAPWKKGRGVINQLEREASVEEAADVLHFVANILAALDVTDEELSNVYAAKQEKNRQRLTTGRSNQTPNGLGRSGNVAGNGVITSAAEAFKAGLRAALPMAVDPSDELR